MRQLLVVLATAVVIAAFAPAAAADQPARHQFAGTVESVLEGACPFSIDVVSVLSARVTVFAYPSGATKKEQYHLVEQDTFSANGKSLAGVPFTFNATWLYDPSGTLTSVFTDGVGEKVPLPDGSLFISAGRFDFFAHGLPTFMLTPDHGASVNLEGFCAALQ